MLEIVFLFALGQKINKMAQERNVKSLPWVLRMIGMWFSVEFLVVLLGLKFMKIEDLSDPTPLLILAIPAMILAYIATQLLVVKRLQNIHPTLNQEVEHQTEESEKPNLDHFR